MPDIAAVVFFGDFITDGACSTVDANHRWPDHVAERLQKAENKDVAVVNQRVFRQPCSERDGMGTNALALVHTDDIRRSLSR